MLCLYNLSVFLFNRNKQFLYYSLYFLCVFLFFLGQELVGHDKVRLFHVLTPSIHCGTFIFYISFAREVLNTKVNIAVWDKKMVSGRLITIFMVPVFIIIHLFFGRKVQGLLFMILGFATFLFTLICYYFFFKIKTRIALLFLIGSFSYTIMAIFSFFAGFSFGTYDDFISKFRVHPTFFMYCGSFFEAIIFSVLIGTKIDILEKERVETIKKINHLKKIVIKNHIILKDKTKVYISDLIYIKAEDHYLNLFLSDGKNHFVRGKLSSIKGELPPNFMQCHRSYIVNTNCIKRNDSRTITLFNNLELPVSKTFLKDF